MLILFLASIQNHIRKLLGKVIARPLDVCIDPSEHVRAKSSFQMHHLNSYQLHFLLPFCVVVCVHALGGSEIGLCIYIHELCFSREINSIHIP